jgi:hypothetical protein
MPRDWKYRFQKPAPLLKSLEMGAKRKEIHIGNSSKTEQ